MERTELDGGLPAWDARTANAIAGGVVATGAYRVVESADEADLVLLVEAQYRTVASFSRGTQTITQIGGDREANVLGALFAILVPADQYRKHGPNVSALLPVQVWSGAAMAPEAQGTASLDSLVRRLAYRAPWPAGFPPLCAGSEAPGADGAAVAMTFGRVDPSGHVSLGPPPRPAGNAAARTTFASGVTYVSVPVTVRDVGGRPVAGLSAADFGIYEDDAAQKVDRLLPMSAAVNLALLVDTSSSMRLERSQVQNAIRGFVARLRPDDRMMLATFDDRVVVQAEFTPDHDRLGRGVSRIRNGRGTRLYDALALAISKRLQPVPDRKAMVIFTDGVDTRSRLADAESTKLQVDESQVPIYVIQFDTRRTDYSLPPGALKRGSDMVPTVLPEGAQDNSALFARADAYLGAVTQLSGGRLFHAADVRGLNDAFGQIATDLGAQYTLAYYPANQARNGTYRKLRVEVNRPDVTVRTRAGYRAESAQPGTQ